MACGARPGSDYREAKELYRRSLELDPELVWALYGLGMVLVNEIARYELAHLGRIDEGRTVYQHSLISRTLEERMKNLLGLTTDRFKERLLEGLALVGADA